MKSAHSFTMILLEVEMTVEEYLEQQCQEIIKVILFYRFNYSIFSYPFRF